MFNTKFILSGLFSVIVYIISIPLLLCFCYDATPPEEKCIQPECKSMSSVEDKSKCSFGNNVDFTCDFSQSGSYITYCVKSEMKDSIKKCDRIVPNQDNFCLGMCKADKSKTCTSAKYIQCIVIEENPEN